MKKDNNLMALLSVWGILLVVLGHSGFEETIIQEKLKFLHDWIYSFHMPLFFMISGYLFSHTNTNLTGINPQRFIQKKTLRLMVPYVVLGIILFAIKYFFSSFSHAARDFSVSSFFLMFIAPACENSTMGYLWYLFTLYIIFLLVLGLCIIKINLKKTIWCLFFLIIAVVCGTRFYGIELFNLSSVFRYLPYFLIGILYKHYEFKVSFLITRSDNDMTSNSNNLNGIKDIFYYSKVGGGIKLVIYVSLSIIFTVVDLSFLGGATAQIIRAVTGLLMSVQLCFLLLDSRWVQKYVLPMSNYTYSIYLLSWFGQYAVKIIAVNILNLHWGIVVFTMFVAGILVPVLVCKIVDRYSLLGNRKWLRLIIGY